MSIFSAINDLEAEQTKAAAPLIKLPGELAIFYQNNTKPWYFSPNSYAYNVSTGDKAEIATDVCAAIVDLLETESFLTVPVLRRGEMIGRLYLTSHQNCFEHSEVEFISQLSEQVLREVENVELLNGLASGAASRQREKISRDLHDTTVQPYIGLKLGLEAIEIKHAAGAAIEKDIEKLIKVTDSTIAELRGYVSTLKGEASEVEGSVLILAVKQQAAKFQEFYDINVRVEASDGFQLNDRLAAEAFQIVSEGLSNIKRHTKAKQGTIFIRRDAEKLFLEIENENREPDAVLDFVPKSIAGRAKSLGGTARVERLDSRTKVSVEIPL
jgi:signal transduction histidine kinase